MANVKRSQSNNSTQNKLFNILKPQYNLYAKIHSSMNEFMIFAITKNVYKI